MATVIPVLGEMHQIAAPGEMSGVDRLIILGGLPPGDVYKREVWEADNGDTFIYHEPTPTNFARDLKFNIRATKFISNRGGFQQVTGTVVFLSPKEWRILFEDFRDSVDSSNAPLKTAPPPPEPTVAVGGNTYPVRHELRALGGNWDPVRKSWVIPQSKEFTARGIVARGPLPAQSTPPAPKGSWSVMTRGDVVVSTYGSKTDAEQEAKSLGNAYVVKSTPERHLMGYSGLGSVLGAKPPLKVDPNEAGKFASGPRRNMKEGSCYKCGVQIPKGAGLLLKDHKNRWVVECLPENQALCKERAFDDSLLEKKPDPRDLYSFEDEGIPQDPREILREEEDGPF